MWKCISLLLFLGQWIIVAPQTTEDEVQRYTRKADCCPCPDSARNTDMSQAASETRECPCNFREADAETASSIFSPVLSAAKPFSRQYAQKVDPKPLLEPEVDLASSVLETLREVTEEEYQDALARDVARSAVETVNPDEAATNLVTIVVAPDARNTDDALPEASNNQETCIHPSFDTSHISGRNSYSSSHSDMTNRAFDMNDAPSNMYDALYIPNNNNVPYGIIPTNVPLRDLLQNIPESLSRSLSFSTNVNRGYYIPNRGNIVTGRPLGIPTLDRRPLFGARRPLDIANLLNLKDVELIPPRKVNIARDRHIKPTGVGKLTPLNIPGSTLSDLLLKNTQRINANGNNDCNGDGTELNHAINTEDQNTHTQILSTVPTVNKFSYAENDLLQPEKSYSNNINDAHTNTAMEDKNCIDDPRKAYPTTNSIARNSPLTRSDFKEENHRHLSPEASNNIEFIQRYSNPAEYDSPSQHRAVSNKPGISKTSSITDSIQKTFNNIKQTNDNINESLMSSIGDILQPGSTQRQAVNDECNTMHENYFTEERSNDPIHMNDLQRMSDNILLNYNERKHLPNLNTGSTIQNYEKNTWPEHFGSDGLTDDRTDDNERESTNEDSCLVYEKSAHHLNSEMKTAASESKIKQHLSRIQSRLPATDRNSYNDNSRAGSIFSTPLEDVNLDIFQYQRPEPNINGIQRSPLLNVKSYKTLLPVDKIDFQPVKLQKAIRRGNDILGATLSMKPHTRETSQEPLLYNLRSSLLQPNGLRIPDINEVRAFLDNNTPNILQLPFLSDRSCNDGSQLLTRLSSESQNLRTRGGETLINVQDTLSNTLKEAQRRNNMDIRDGIISPTTVFETIADANEDMNDRLYALRLNLNDRLKKLHDSLTGQARVPILGPLHQSRTKPKYSPRTIKTENKNILNSPKSPTLRQPLGSANREKTNIRPSIAKEKSAVFSPIPRQPTIIKSDVNKRIENSKPAAKKPLPLHERIKLSRESTGIVSLTTTKKPPTLPSIPKVDPLFLQRPRPIDERTRSLIPERGGLKRKEILREPKTSPSNIDYACETNRATSNPSLFENIGKESIQTANGLLPKLQNAQKKSLLPSLADNAFLSKVKEAVTKDIKDFKPIGDIIPAASETVRNTEPSDLSYNCKMVCSKS